MKTNNIQGFMLVEILIAITIVAVALLAIGGLVMTSSKSLAANDVQTLAYKTAQARIEALKSVPANNWKEIGFTTTYQNVTTAIAAVANATTRTTLTNNIVTNTTPANIDARFTLLTEGRNVTVSGAGSRLVEVRVTVSWTAASGQTAQVVLVTLFGRDP